MGDASDLIHVNNFRGESPKHAPRKLGNNQSQVAQNVALWSGEIVPIKESLSIARLSKAGTIQTIYRLGTTWLHWTQDVDVARTPLAVDFEHLVHYTGHYNPKSTTPEMAESGGTDYPMSYYRLGLPPPHTAPTVGISGGSAGTGETRAYVYTYVTSWGEEGPPSPATEFTSELSEPSSWEISGLDVAPPNELNITDVETNTPTAGRCTVTMSGNHFATDGEYWLFEDLETGSVSDLNGTRSVTRHETDQTKVIVELVTSQNFQGAGTASREAPINTTDMVKRIYRADSNGVYRYVGEVPVASPSFRDTLENTELGTDSIPVDVNYQWVAPPGDLKGLINFPNQIIAGFRENEVCFCVPGQPYAWPLAYRYTLDYSVVGLGVYGNTLVVATTGTPYRMIGIHSENMTQARLDYEQACISKKSIVSIGSGVIYASPDGLVLVGSGPPTLITDKLFEKQEWIQYSPETLDGYLYDNRYYGFYSDGGELDNIDAALVFDPTEPSAYFTRLSLSASAGYTDLEHDDFFIVRNQNDLEQYETSSIDSQGFWKSKEFVMNRPVNLSVGKVRASFNAEINETERESFVVNRWAQVENRIKLPRGRYEGRTLVLFADSPELFTTLMLATFPLGSLVSFFLGSTWYSLGWVQGYRNNYTGDTTDQVNQVMIYVYLAFTNWGAADLPSGTMIRIPRDWSMQPYISAVTHHDTEVLSGAELSGSLGGFQANQYTINGGPYAAEVYEELKTVSELTFRLFADGDLMYTQTIDSSRPFRLPGGYLADEYSFEISARQCIVHDVSLSETMSDLAKV